MTCTSFRDLVSAAIDQQLTPDDQQRLDSHLATCASCAVYNKDAWALHRSLTMRTVPTGPATTNAPALNLAGDLRGVSALRWVLMVIGLTLVVINVQSLLTTGASDAAHISRHDGVFGTALGIGMVAVAIKPHRAMGLLPLTSTIALLMTFVAVLDLASGKVGMISEAIHVVEFAGLACLWVVSGGPTRLATYVDALPRLRGAQAR